MRWLYAMKEAWLHRKALKSFMTDQANQINSLAELTPERLDKANIAILALDFDGVLAPHGEAQPTPQNEAWLKALCLHMGEQRIVIYSNKPIPARIAYFAKNFPMIFFVQGVRKKPYPDGLGMIAEYKGVLLSRVALVDDRLLTGMLATQLAYAQGFYFTKPEKNYLKRPVTEAFFSMLRALERLFIRMI